MADYQLIPLNQIQEDPDQPRRQIDDQAIAELASTIRTVGVIEPVLVRPHGRGFRLVVGHRRYRAAKLAGLKQLPCIVRPQLSELEVMRMQAVEDAQNEELDPRDRYAFWAKLWKAESRANPALTLGRFAKEVIGKSEGYVKSGIQVSEEAPRELRELLGKPEDGKLNPSYARYIVNDASLRAPEKVAVARKIASGRLPASGGRIGTETLRIIRSAPPKIRERLIHDPDFGLEQAKWELRHEERTRAAKNVKQRRLLSPGQFAFKLLRAVLDFHIKLDPKTAPFLPQEAWQEVDHRLTNLEKRIHAFRAARHAPIRSGEELIDAIDIKALEAFLAQDDQEVK